MESILSIWIQCDEMNKVIDFLLFVCAFSSINAFYTLTPIITDRVQMAAIIEHMHILEQSIRMHVEIVLPYSLHSC